MLPGAMTVVGEEQMAIQAARLGIRFPMTSMSQVNQLVHGLWSHLNGGERAQLLVRFVQQQAPHLAQKAAEVGAQEGLSLAECLVRLGL
jgi:hypothetical protein